MAWTQPKTWSSEPLVAGDMNTHIRDNLEALKDPPSDNYELNELSDYSTTSTSFVDVDSTNLAFTIVTNGGDVLIGFHGTVSGGTGNIDPCFDVDIDGTLVAGDDGIIVSQSGARLAVSFVRLVTGLSAGSHTFKLQWKARNAGTITLFAGAGGTVDDHPQFWVREVS